MGFGSAHSKYAKTEIFNDGDSVEFVDGGKWSDVDFSKSQDKSDLKKVFQINVSINGGENKLLNLNKTSGNILFNAWGSEEAGAWKGKKTKAGFITMMAFGKVQKVLVLNPI
jgi:hypothetical protein